MLAVTTGVVYKRAKYLKMPREYIRIYITLLSSSKVIGGYAQEITMNTTISPDGIFTMEELESGGVIIHILGVLYMFMALSIVCDEFFVPALEVIAEKLHLSPDVAGATFMAAGGSAPELFTNVAGVFVFKSEVGIGTVVGSAVFNILFVIGICSLTSKELLVLTWWPLFRDVVFYSVSLILLIVFFRDSTITIIESVVLMLCYIAYCTFMKFNEKIQKRFRKSQSAISVNSSRGSKGTQASGIPKKVMKRSTVGHILLQHELQDGQDTDSKDTGTVRSSSSQTSEDSEESDDSENKEPTQQKSSTQNFKTDSPTLNIPKRGSQVDRPVRVSQQSLGYDLSQNANTAPIQLSMETEHADGEGKLDHGEDEPPPEPLDMSWPDSYCKRIEYVLLLPITFPLWLTLPDVRRKEKVKFVIITFFGSIAWIGFYSYLMVGAAEISGEVFGISSTIMGLTVLAAGTSVPDLLTSVIVARKGFGDMAVSSSVGSNLFDITVGLPVPWFLYCLIFNKTYPVSNEGMICSVAMLFIMLIAVVSAIAIFRWRMYKALGIVMLLLYGVFLIFAVLLENKTIVCKELLSNL